jgi:RNA polymerase-binding transcription factor DksA
VATRAATGKTATGKAAADAGAATPVKAAAKAPAKASSSTSKKAATRKKAATKVPATRSGARPQRLRVRDNEKPWTVKELADVRAELEADIVRLRGEISEAEVDLADLMRDAGDGAGDDQADAGTATFEREQEISLANNAREMYDQSRRALSRIVDGTYGECESCGDPIGKNRLLAFPRATLCLTCKSKQERR